MSRPDAAWRPLRAWSRARCDGLAAEAAAVLQAWCRAWGMPSTLAEGVGVRPADPRGWSSCDEGRPTWTAWSSRHGDRGWAVRDPGAPGALHAALFGQPARGGTLAAELVDAALDGAWQQLAAWAGLAPRPAGLPPDAEVMATWAGAVQVDLPLGRWLLSGDWVARRMPVPPRPAASVVPLRAGLARHTLQLELRLQPTAIELARLAGLRAGMVLPLDHGLHHPLRLTDADGRDCFSGWLVDLDGLRAVELASTPIPPACKEAPCTP